MTIDKTWNRFICCVSIRCVHSIFNDYSKNIRTIASLILVFFFSLFRFSFSVLVQFFIFIRFHHRHLWFFLSSCVIYQCYIQPSNQQQWKKWTPRWRRKRCTENSNAIRRMAQRWMHVRTKPKQKKRTELQTLLYFVRRHKLNHVSYVDVDGRQGNHRNKLCWIVLCIVQCWWCCCCCWAEVNVWLQSQHDACIMHTYIYKKAIVLAVAVIETHIFHRVFFFFGVASFSLPLCPSNASFVYTFLSLVFHLLFVC